MIYKDVVSTENIAANLYLSAVITRNTQARRDSCTCEGENIRTFLPLHDDNYTYWCCDYCGGIYHRSERLESEGGFGGLVVAIFIIVSLVMWVMYA